MFHSLIKAVWKAKFLLLTVGLVFVVQSLAAQEPARLTLTRQRMTISQLFREIERQTGNVVVVRSNAVDDGRTIDLGTTSGTLDYILGYILAGTGKGYEITDGYIIIGTRREQSPKPILRPQPERPIIIPDSELRQFTPQSVEVPAVQRGPMSFGAEDKLFYTPGRTVPGGVVAKPFSTAERWQRSKLALKTNVFYGLGTLTPNLRAELGLGNRTSLEAGVAYNGWNLDGTVDNNRKLVHGVAMAEFRYWLCERFEGHFFGLHAFGGFYNVGGRNVPMLFEKEFRYEGTTFGAGISYGYMLPLSPRWGIEFNVGVGVAKLHYDKYGCNKCDQLEGTFDKVYFGPTRAAINLVFIIR